MAKSFLKFLRVFFSYNINKEICTKLLLNNFGNNFIVFLFFSGLGNSSRLGLQTIYDVSNHFFFKHSLNKVNLLVPVFKAFKLFLFLQLSFLMAILNKKVEV